jgi:hypothetical protein
VLVLVLLLPPLLLRCWRRPTDQPCVSSRRRPQLLPVPLLLLLLLLRR